MHTGRPLRWAVVIAWMCLLTYWSGQSALLIDDSLISKLLGGFQHRLAHLAAYATLGAIAHWSLPNRAHRRSIWVAVAVTSLFGALDELHQNFVPGRRAAFDDWAFDSAAGLVGAYLSRRHFHDARIMGWHPGANVTRTTLAGLFALGCILAFAPRGFGPDAHRPVAIAIADRVSTSHLREAAAHRYQQARSALRVLILD